MKTGDLIFIRPNKRSFISRLIGKSITSVTGQEFSHVAMVVSDHLVFEAQAFQKSRVTDFYYEDFEVVRMDINAEQRISIIEYLDSQKLIGKEYDYKEVFGLFLQYILKPFKILLNLNKYDSDEKLICIEAIVRVYSEALGIDICGKPESSVTFTDLFNNSYKVTDTITETSQIN